ncbi:MAG: hypothetical protein AAF806_30130 [Bacteroidota bacterium]
MSSQSYPSCDQLHQKAMDAANLAVELQRKGDQQAALQQFQIAFSWEKQAAMLLSFNTDAEPSATNYK